MTALSTFAMLAIMSGITIALILLFKKLAGRRLSPVFHYYIWLLLIIRLMFPVLPQSRLSLFNVFDSFASLSFDISGVKSPDFYVLPSDEADKTDSGSASDNTDSPLSGDEVSEDESSASAYGVIETIETVNEKDFGIALKSESDITAAENKIVYIAWAAVSAILLTFGLLKYNIQRRGVLRRVSPCYEKDVLSEAEFILAAYRIKRNVEIYWGDKSMLLGVFSPAVIIDRANRPKRLPDGSISREYELVLAHELTHLHRRDNIKNFFYGALACLYWFNPLVWFAFSHMRDDAELLCDYTALKRFRLCSGKYAGLLCSSIRDTLSSARTPAAAPAMSRAGRQLIRRLNFISSRDHRTCMPIRIVSLVISAAIAALCLTNPIAAVKSGGNHDNYLIKYSELLSDATIEFPDADTALTVRGFIDSVLLALDSAELPLAVRSRIGAMRSAGAEYLLEEMIQYPYRSLAPKLYNEFIASITPDSPITREQAAFLLNAMLLLAERDLLVTSDTVPQILSQSDYEYTLSSLDSAAARRKLSAFFSLKSVFTTDSSGNRSYSSDEAAQSLINNSPLCVIFPFYSFDPYASRRERIMLLDYLGGSTDFNAYQQLASITDPEEYARFIETVPPLLPQVLPADSFKNDLIGTITDAALKAEISELYEPYSNTDYPDTPMYILAVMPDEAYAFELTIRLLENSSYTYAMMARDQASCGFDYLSMSRSILPMRDYSFVRDDGSEVVYSILGKKEFEYLNSLATPEEKRLLKAYFILKDPNDQSLNSAYRERIAQTFRIDTAVYIFDPEATAHEREEIDAIIAKYKTDYTSVYALPVRMYEAYRDEGDIDNAALNSVRCLQSYGVFDTGDYFYPHGAVTFADAAEMIVRLYSVLMIY